MPLTSWVPSWNSCLGSVPVPGIPLVIAGLVIAKKHCPWARAAGEVVTEHSTFQIEPAAHRDQESLPR
jgi:hypothetical protein